ncbi:MAG TPA: cytochrome c [Candidatus Limnocylindrales bacterium]|jgi:putative copper resistance protein D
MTVVFPPPLDVTLLGGLLLLALGALGYVAARRLRASGVGRAVVTLRIPALVAGVVLTLSAFFAPTPETYLPNPIPRTVDSIAAGEGVFLNNCAACHGIDARGGGPLAPTTSVPPPALTGPGSHLGHHTDGDLHYIINNGLAGGMPAWSGTLTDEQVWHVINYLRSLSDGGAPATSSPGGAVFQPGTAAGSSRLSRMPR